MRPSVLDNILFPVPRFGRAWAVPGQRGQSQQKEGKGEQACIRRPNAAQSKTRDGLLFASVMPVLITYKPMNSSRERFAPL